jgi:cell division protein FtsA
MATTEFIAAVELGSSKIAGMVGQKDGKGNIEVKAFVTESSSNFVHKGVVFNLDKATASIVGLVNRLSFVVGQNISKIYVGVGGQSFHSLKNKIKRELPAGSEISEDIINSICDENREIKIPDRDIWDVVTLEYVVGSGRFVDPIGVVANSVEGVFLNIVARSEIKKNLERCFSQAHIELADDPYIIPLLLGEYVLNEPEKRMGCALVDFGADVTTVSVYSKGILRFLSVLPLGGSNITHDLMSAVNIEEDEAEELKLHYGDAQLKPTDMEDEDIILRDGDRKVKLSLIMDVVEARTEEIIANVWNQIVMSSYEGRLTAGLIFTGGGSNTRHLNDAFSKYTHKNMKIRTALNINNSSKVTGVTIPTDGTQNGLLCMLLRGRENCCAEHVIEPEPEVPAIPVNEEKEETVSVSSNASDEEDETLAVSDNIPVQPTEPEEKAEPIEEENPEEEPDTPQENPEGGSTVISALKELLKPKQKTPEELAAEEKEREERAERERLQKIEREKRRQQKEQEKQEKIAKEKARRIAEEEKNQSKPSFLQRLADRAFKDSKMNGDEDE